MTAVLVFRGGSSRPPVIVGEVLGEGAIHEAAIECVECVQRVKKRRRPPPDKNLTPVPRQDHAGFRWMDGTQSS